MGDPKIPLFFTTATGAPLEPDVLAELESIARTQALSAEEMFYKWDSYCIRRDVDATELTLAMVRAFKQDLQDALDKSRRQRQQQHQAGRWGAGAGMGTMMGTPRAKNTGGGDVFGMLDGLVPTTPGSQKIQRSSGPSSMHRKPYATPSAPRIRPDILSSSPPTTTNTIHDHLSSLSALLPGSFADRPGAGEVLKVLNGHLAAASPPPVPWPRPRIKLTANSDQKKVAYKGLAMKLSEAAEVLDDRIDEFVVLAQDHHALEPSAFGNPATQATAPVVAVGRIASDALDGTSKLNAASVVLETSRRSGAGLRVPLNLGRLPGFSLFPGQIVALRGINSSGHEFVVDEILDLPLPLSAASTPALLEQHAARLRATATATAPDADAMDTDEDDAAPPPPLSVFLAAGPYTADDNLDFEPLHELCRRAADENVDVLILAGPFLDADHPLIASGDFDLPADVSYDPDTFTMALAFKHLVAPAIARLTKPNPSASVILVPSVRDVLDTHVSWPQDVLHRRWDIKELHRRRDIKEDLGLSSSVRLVTNPITLSLNETMLAVSTLDVLFELKAEELVAGKPPGGPDTLPRLARHVIEQRHYYPIFPPVDRSRLPRTGTAEGVATGAVLDTGYLRLGEMCNVKPDIMLLPSAMPPFVEGVESVLVINPGTLSKRRGAGTFVKLALHQPIITLDSPPDVPVGHRIFERARVDIVKI